MSSTSLTTSQVATAAALVVASLSVGYTLGKRSVSADAKQPVVDVKPTEPDVDAEDSDEEDVADGDLAAVKPGFMEQCKLVLVVRTDLGMSSGKIAAHHATLACYKALLKTNPGLLQHWERTGQAKIALKGTSEEQLDELEAVAKSLNLCARAIHDAGRTQIAAGSKTVLGIGPAPVELINKVTGKLRLL